MCFVLEMYLVIQDYTFSKNTFYLFRRTWTRSMIKTLILAYNWIRPSSVVQIGTNRNKKSRICCLYLYKLYDPKVSPGVRVRLTFPPSTALKLDFCVSFVLVPWTSVWASLCYHEWWICTSMQACVWACKSVGVTSTQYPVGVAFFWPASWPSLLHVPRCLLWGDF